MIQLTKVSVFKVIRTSHPTLQHFNKGFNGEIEVGIFHFIARNTLDGAYLITKPVKGFDEQIFIPQETFDATCEELLSFNLHNN